MRRIGLTMAVALLVGWATAGAWAQRFRPAELDELAKQPAAGGRGEWVELLNRWYKAGEAAGNVGDTYDNRDGGHSLLRADRTPQVRLVLYTEQERKRRHNWALMRNVWPFTVVGNSSTSSGPNRTGSNPRSAYAVPVFLSRLHEQYRRNNLYIYPEHRDYDPGRLGRPGHGDLYPLNSPYVIISRGSSGSDRIFLEAVFHTLAAFGPKVKSELSRKGLLMPTVQMILRRTLKGIDSDAAYMTGKAHPTAFDGDSLQILEMVKLAHEMTPAKLPPLAQLKVLEESPSEPMRDMTIGRHPEQRAQTPQAISRVFQGARPAYRMVVSADKSIDVNDKPLRYRWKVLRGDAERIEIKPRDEQAAVVELIVPFHDGPMQCPDAPAIPHNRVDIACFADNGDYLSAPAFVSFFMPPDQRRWVDEAGRLREIGYGVPETEVALGRLDDEGAAYAHLAADDRRGALLRGLIADRSLAQRLPRYAAIVAEAYASVDAAHTARQQAHDVWRKAKKQDAPNQGELRNSWRERTDVYKKARATFDEKIRKPIAEGEASPRRFLIRTLESMLSDPQKIAELTPQLIGQSRRAKRELDRLQKLGLLSHQDYKAVTLTPLRKGDGPPGERLTDYEREMVRHFGLRLLHESLGRSLRLDGDVIIDKRIYFPRDWRDIFHHDADGVMTGWTRRHPDGRVEEYRADGRILVKVEGTDQREARPVRYTRKKNKVIVEPQ